MNKPIDILSYFSSRAISDQVEFLWNPLPKEQPIPLSGLELMKCARKIRLCKYRIVPSLKSYWGEVNMILNALNKANA